MTQESMDHKGDLEYALPPIFFLCSFRLPFWNKIYGPEESYKVPLVCYDI